MRKTLGKIKRKLLSYLREDVPAQTNGQLPVPMYHIMETEPIGCRKSELTAPRLNLMVPALSIRYAFGGINTAIEFFIKLCAGDADVRILVTDEVHSDLLALPHYDRWNLIHSDDPDRPGKVIVCFGDRSQKTIPVRRHDIFLATAWWTAYTAEGILKWQHQQWNAKPLPLVYLVQDFEPGFYKWSSRYAMCLSTYHFKNQVAVINTKLLADFLFKNDIHFSSSYIFEPSLNRTLASFWSSRKDVPKKRKIVFYGRPTVERNGFEILVKGFQLWSAQYPAASQWEVISLGELYGDIPLQNGGVIRVLGKLSLQEYAELLLTSAVGASLMISPHPSYPPLEMAAFDMGVITNEFYNKNLSLLHKSIYSLENLHPEYFASLLAELCAKFESDPDYFRNNSFRNFNFIDNPDNFHFIKDLRKELRLNQS